MRNSKVDMLHGPLFKNIVIFAIPVILGGWMQLFFHAADVVVIGQFCGSASVGAMGATGAISNLIINMFMGLSAGVTVTVANAAGSRDDNMIQKAVHTAILTAIIGGLCVACIGVPMAPTLLRWMDTPVGVIGKSTLYMRIILGGNLFSLLYNFGAAVMRAVGDSRKPLFFVTISGALNVLHNLFFVLVLKMDVAGVALATVIANATSSFLVLRSLSKRTDACRFVISRLAIHKESFKKILRIGIPSGIQASMFAISNVIIQSSINSFGEAMMSANTAGGNINGFMANAVTGFGTAAINFVGQNMGAKKYHRVRRVIWTCVRISSVLGLVLGSITYIFGRPLLGIYITDSPEAIAYGFTRLKYMSIPYTFYAIYDAFSASLRGLGKSSLAMAMSLCGTCAVRVLWIYTVFAAFRTPDVLYLSYPISWCLTAIGMCTCVLLTLRKLPKHDMDEITAV
ncbi:MAG: MATE family efflux transporter [Clostridia bacterium]|nr:MATE family efflux transporter [Clostridia bacterium]